ncbi:glycosyl transferase family 2 [Scytonema hofmannii PCC 7110]|uniref:Glycosyl transferase family 2 n=1 Tax=Scytonema hofmannii PCC 7110 TaxID=128403 RepID=A0A139X9S0_9CYAN|nr:glycosyltransferase family A protein [Scytonema hofmannii]KYC41431.1 glycosyl transferase family 2 [Scytonema hofmannii PCC 7110]
MGQAEALSVTQLPSFSIVLETENLANTDLNGFYNSLTSLTNQDISFTHIHQVLLIDSGDVPPAKLKQLQENCPWITVHQAPSETSYYKAKMLGVAIATGDVVVYCDSDCVYEKNWLRNLLTPFTQDNNIQVVAGETTVRGWGPYGTAMALTYIFPQYSGQKNLTKTTQYFLNNVAFRRDFLLKYPIPIDLPLYRGNCVIHAQNIRSNGYFIWRQPQARASHAPPNGLYHFCWRFLLIGHDYYWQKYLLARVKSEENYQEPISGFKGKLQVFFDRIGKMLSHNPHHLIYLPFAVPIALTAVFLIFVGYLLTHLKPQYLLKFTNS